jgi:hypothetical protein
MVEVADPGAAGRTELQDIFQGVADTHLFLIATVRKMPLTPLQVHGSAGLPRLEHKVGQNLELGLRFR